VLAGAFCVACGKKGPPLPPLIKLPVAPADLAVDLRGTTADVQFVVPGANTDNTRPANVERVDVYAVTSPDPVAPAEIVKRGTRVGTVAVKAPKDPDDTIDEDEPSVDMTPPEGKGLDQGAQARLTEKLEGPALSATPLNDRRKQKDAPAPDTGPLLGPRPIALARTYVAVGVTTRGRQGPASKPVTIPILAPPPAPDKPTLTYDESAITVAWPAIASHVPVQRASTADDLPSKPFGLPSVDVRYNVYEVPPKAAPAKLTASPIGELSFSDPRIVWGAERCYEVRAVEIVSGLAIESAATTSVCATPKDTFPPAAPANLLSSPLEHVINLIWDPNQEKDLAGYIVLRGTSAETLALITPEPIQATTFRDDQTPSGVRFVYAVQAVDKSGNVSQRSNIVEEAAR